MTDDEILVVRFLGVHRHLNDDLQERCLEHIVSGLYPRMKCFIDEQLAVAFSSSPVAVLRWSCHYRLSSQLLHRLRAQMPMEEDPWQWTFLLQWAVALSDSIQLAPKEWQLCIGSRNFHLWRALAQYGRRFPHELEGIKQLALPPPLLLLLSKDGLAGDKPSLLSSHASSGELLEQIDRALSFQHRMYDLGDDHSIHCDCPDY